MVSSRRSARVKARRDVAKGSPNKGVKKKMNDNKNDEKGARICKETKQKEVNSANANDGTKPTAEIRRKGKERPKQAAAVDLTGDGNEIWNGHMDKEHDEREKYKKKQTVQKKGKTQSKNAFIRAINERAIELDDSDAEDSDEEETEITFHKESDNSSSEAVEKGQTEAEAHTEHANEEPSKSLDSQDQTEGDEDSKDDERSEEEGDNPMDENTKAPKSVAFPVDEDDIGMNDLGDEEELEMEIDENETPAGEARVLCHPDIERECRYAFIVKTKPSTKPFQTLRSQIVKFLENLQEQVGKEVHVGQWDLDGADEVPTIKKPEDVPTFTGMSKVIYAAYFQGYPSPKRNEEVTMFLRIRLTTEAPEKLQVPLAEIGQTIYDETPEGLGINLGRNPYSCQAAQVTTLGWLFGSTKAISSKSFVPALRKKLDLPEHVPIGVQWRTTKNSMKKQHKWNHEDHPPQAIHVDIDTEYANRFYNVAAKIFKKRSKKRIQGMRLRIVPCFGSDRAKALTIIQKSNCELMQAKQQYLCNSHISRIETNHILNLDRPVGLQQTTLRKYLMSRAPKGSLVQRLFMSVDPAWKGKGHILVTTKPYFKEAMDMMNTMIPECIHAYGMEAAQTWFSNSGLEAYRGVKWDPKKKSTSSNQDYESMALVEEDLFELGNEWRMKAPILQVNSKRDETFVSKTVEEVLDKRVDDSDVKSLGSILGRSHDGDTVQSEKPIETKEPAKEGEIRFTGMEVAIQAEKEVGMDESLAGTSAAKTTNSVRARLKDTEAENARIRKEYQDLLAHMSGKESDGESVSTAKTTQSTKARCVALTLAAEIKDDTLADQARQIEQLKQMLASQTTTTTVDTTNQASENHPNQAPVQEGHAVTMANGDGQG